ncbi:MAG: M50 family metallopeptidase [Chloroflexota bacterium]|nr:M50 family metallopeptidase [Chloroflexota bacterium]
MRMLLRAFWGLVLLLSILWIAAGLAVAADIMPGDTIMTEFTAQVENFASRLNVDQIEGYSTPVFFVASGAPLFLIAAFFFRRNNRAPRSRKAKAGAGTATGAEGESAIPVPFPDSKPAQETKGNVRALRRQTLLISALAFLAVFFLWNQREMEMLLYPLRLFVTFVHEAGHALAALISGGQVQGFTVNANGSGMAVTAGGNRALILPAGYLGAALFGSLLFLLSNRAPRWASGIAMALGAILIGITVLYGRPDSSGVPVALAIGVGFGTIILLIGAKAPRIVNQLLLSILAVITALEAVYDLKFILDGSLNGTIHPQNDAVRFAQEFTPLLPVAVVALLWAGIAVFMLAAAIYFGMFKPLRNEIQAVVNGQS